MTLTIHVMFPHPLSLRTLPALQRFMSCSPIHCHCADNQHCNASCHVPPSTVIAHTTSIATLHVMFPHPLSLRRQPALQRFMSCSPIHCHCTHYQHCNASCHVLPSTVIAQTISIATLHVMFPHPLSLRRQPALQRFMSCSPIHCHCADNQHCNASCPVPPSTVIAQTTSIATLHVMFPHPLSLRRQPALHRALLHAQLTVLQCSLHKVVMSHSIL